MSDTTHRLRFNAAALAAVALFAGAAGARAAKPIETPEVPPTLEVPEFVG